MGLIGSANVFLYALTAVCLFFFRKQLKREGKKVEDLKFRTLLYPIIPILLIVICAVMVVGMFFHPTQMRAITGDSITYISIFIGRTIYSKIKGNENTNLSQAKT